MNGSQNAFFQTIWSLSVSASKSCGVLAQIIAAQAILETGWGVHAPGNNYFGIKAVDGGVSLPTHEFIAGKLTSVSSKFNSYISMEESFEGYAYFIQHNRRYRSLTSAKTLSAQLSALQASGYSTNPKYAGLLAAIISEFPTGNNLGQSALAVTPETKVMTTETSTAAKTSGVFGFLTNDLGAVGGFLESHSSALNLAGNIIKGLLQYAPIPAIASQEIEAVGDGLISTAEGVNQAAQTIKAAAVSPQPATVTVPAVGGGNVTVSTAPAIVNPVVTLEGTVLASSVAQLGTLLPELLADLSAPAPAGSSIGREILGQVETAGEQVLESIVATKSPTAN